MPETWKGPSSVGTFWTIVSAAATVIFVAGGFYASTNNSIGRLSDRQSNTAAAVAKVSQDLTTAQTTLEQAIDTRSNNDRNYTDLAIGRSEKDEQRDIAELNEKITTLQKGQDDQNKKLDNIHDVLGGIQADLKYAISQKARGG